MVAGEDCRPECAPCVPSAWTKAEAVLCGGGEEGLPDIHGALPPVL